MASDQTGLPLGLQNETHDCCTCTYWRRRPGGDGYGRCHALDMNTYERGAGCRLTYRAMTDKETT